MGFKGGVTASTEKTVGQGDLEWIFKLDPNTGDPTPDSYTLERRLSDGTTMWDRTVAGCLVPQFTISAEQNGDVTNLAYDWWGSAPNANAITAALSVPAVFTMLPALSWKVFFDASWAAMDTFAAAPSYDGGAQIATTVKSFTLTYKGGIEPALYIGDGRTDPSAHRFRRRGFELSMDVEYNANVLAEQAKAAAGSKTYVRLLGEGARIGTGFNKTFLAQGAFVYPDGGFGEIGGDDDGAETLSLKLESVSDDDAEDCEIKVINTIATFP
jgi:hypothetical protein